MNFLLLDDNLIFMVSLCLMLFIAIAEGLLTVIGLGIVGALSSFLPDFELDTHEANGETKGIASHFLSWLKVGQLPALVILVVVLTSFGVTGLLLQSALLSVASFTLPSFIAWLPAFILSLPLIRAMNSLLGKIGFKDETEVIHTNDLVGLVATVTIGTAEKGNPAEARVTDRFQTTHYVLVEPDTDISVQQGQTLLLIKKNGNQFIGITPTHSSLNK